MKINKIKISMCNLFFVFILFSFHMVSAEAVDINAQTLNQELEKAYTKKELAKFGKKLDILLEQSPNSPMLMFIKGDLYGFMAKQKYYDVGEKNDDSVKFLINEKNKILATAMELDLTYEPHLTASQYHVIAPGLPLELKLEAYRRELKFKNIGEYSTARDNVYSRMLSALYGAERYEDAIELVNQMIVDPAWLAIWPDPSKEIIGAKEQIAKYEKKIKERDATQTEKDNTQQTDDKQTQLKTAVEPTSANQPMETTLSNKPESIWLNDHRIGYLLLIIAIIMALAFMTLRRKKKK